MAALEFRLAQHCALVHATDSSLDDNTSVTAEPPGLDADLLSQLSGRGDDDGANIVGTSSPGAAAFCKFWVGLNDSLNGGEEEA